MARTLSEATRRAIIDEIPDYTAMLYEQQEQAVIRVIAGNFYFYCERNLMIEDKLSSDLIPFQLNWAQKKLIQLVLEDIAAGRPVRYIILKARQMGLSTAIEALCFWWTTTHRNFKSLIIAHETDAATTLYEMFKRYFDNAHYQFQPSRKYNNKKELVFDVDDRTKEEWREHVDTCAEPETCGVSHKPPGLASSIRTMVAREGKGRSQMNKFLHGSEVAFWEAKADVASAAIQTVPSAPNTFIFLESTANGVGGFFYDTWQAAKKGKNNLRPLFFAWHEHYEYEMDGDCGGVYDEEEIKLLEIFEAKGYARETWDRKIIWRRMKKRDFLDDPKKFYQEYPKDDMEAFIASGRPRFDVEMLMRMEEYAMDHQTHRFGVIVPVEVGYGLGNQYKFDEVPQVMEGLDPTPLKVWELPIKRELGVGGHGDMKYILGVDVSEGKLNKESSKKENDYSVIDVTRADNFRTVARWRGHIDPDLLGGIVNQIGRFYNNALVGVEVNNHGLTTVQRLRNDSYPNLYMRESSEEHRFQERTSLMGWRTDKKTKKLIIDNLAQAIREGDIIDLDLVFIRECMTYIRDDQGHTNAQEGQFDDTVMAKAIALQLSDYESIDTNELKEKISKRVKRNKNATSTESSNLDSIARPGVRRPNGRYAEARQRRREARAVHRRSR